MRVLGGAALVVATMLALTGCGSQATQPTRTATVTVAPPPSTSAPTTEPPTSTPSASASATADPEPSTPPPAADPGAPKNQCTDLGVTVIVSRDGGGAGSLDYEVLFTNTGGETCALRGTPGVSVVGDRNGTQLGKPADRIQTGVKTLTLQAGDTVAAPLRITNIAPNGGPLDSCTVVKGDGYRVYPPHSTKAYYSVDAKAVACAPGPSFMTVGPVAVRSR